jgi:phosphoglycolate phosphatase
MTHHLPDSIKAVVFDLDGTLIDSEADLRAAVNRVFDEIGRRPITRNEVVMMVGDGVPKLVERALEATGGLPDDGTDDVVARFLEFYSKARSPSLGGGAGKTRHRSGPCRDGR